MKNQSVFRRVRYEPASIKASSKEKIHLLNLAQNNQRIVVVCSECSTASCWQGFFMCEKAKNAGVIEKTVGELKDLGLEHPSWWDRKY